MLAGADGSVVHERLECPALETTAIDGMQIGSPIIWMKSNLPKLFDITSPHLCQWQTFLMPISKPCCL